MQNSNNLLRQPSVDQTPTMPSQKKAWMKPEIDCMDKDVIAKSNSMGETDELDVPLAS